MDKNKDIFSVSNSILISGILIAASIFFGGKYVSQGTQADLTTRDNPNEPSTVEIARRSGQATKGTGEVVIYEFSDFECPYCQNFWSTTYQQIKEEYIDTGKVTFIYRQFPLSQIHPLALKAAEAS